MKSRKKNGTGNRDHISNLPDDIISNILSCLCTKDAVQTCVLSRAWENKWTSIYNIDISLKGGHSKLTFVEFMDMVLFNMQNVRGFRLVSRTVFQKEDASRLKTWLSTVFRRNIDKVMIELIGKEADFILPRSLSNCTSLKELDMKIYCYWKTSVNSYFPNLTTVSLTKVRIKNESLNSDTLVFHFPVLKTFEICSHAWLNVRFVEFYAPALIDFFSDTDSENIIDSYTVKIIGARLQKFRTLGSCVENFVLAESTVSYASLENEDDLYGDDNTVKCGLQIRRLLNESSGVKSLQLSCYLAQALAATKPGLPISKFYNLERLALFCEEWYGQIRVVVEGLFELLRSAPVLKSLSIVGVSMLDLNYKDDYHCGTSQPVPSCVVSHLEEVMIEIYTADIRLHHLIKYFVENGPKLKKLSLSCYDDIDKDNARKLLSGFSKPSTSLEIDVHVLSV